MKEEKEEIFEGLFEGFFEGSLISFEGDQNLEGGDFPDFCLSQFPLCQLYVFFEGPSSLTAMCVSALSKPSTSITLALQLPQTVASCFFTFFASTAAFPVF